jgi:dTDP-4-dehydrorhamnose 3,5-epimerase
MKVVYDLRGFSGEIISGANPYILDYWSRSRNRVIRGLHYRKPPQFGLLTVVRGCIYDVMVHLKTAQHLAREVDEGEQVWVPIGYAHGFCVISEWADVLYKLSQPWQPECEYGIIWNDPALHIAWPTDSPILSDRDSKWPLFRDRR